MSQSTEMDQSANGEPDNRDAATERRGLTGVCSWLASGALHGTIALLIATVAVFISEPDPIDLPPGTISTIAPPVQPPRETTAVNLTDPQVMIELAIESETPSPLAAMDLPVESPQSEELTDSTVQKGREEAVSASETGSTGVFLAIGSGSSSAGMFGSRSGGGRKRALRDGGGTEKSETSVRRSLDWFKRHQSPNGMWDHERYFLNCTDDAKCEPGTTAHDSAEDLRVCMTGYALLCYLGAGHDHRTPGPYKSVVKRGLTYLLSMQQPDGVFAARNYAHAVAAMALAEAYAMSSDPELRSAAQSAVDVIVSRQNQDPKGQSGYAGLGWDYSVPTQRNDASVTGWNVMALKSAFAAGLRVGSSMDGAKRWLDQAWKANNDGKAGRPDWRKLDPYTDESLFSYEWTTGESDASGKIGHQAMAPVGMVCAVFLGHRAGDPMLETLANYVMNKQTPKAYPTNTYYMYYNTLGIYQLGTQSPRWKVWNSVVRDMLVGAQRGDEGCMRGSWDWKGTEFAGHEIGRVLSTAYNTLCLEVYYRFKLMQ